MAKIKLLKHSVIITGKTFEDCKMEYNRICDGVKNDFSIECDMKKLIFSDMTVREDECVAVFQMPDCHIDYFDFHEHDLDYWR